MQRCRRWRVNQLVLEALKTGVDETLAVWARYRDQHEDRNQLAHELEPVRTRIQAIIYRRIGDDSRGTPDGTNVSATSVQVLNK